MTKDIEREAFEEFYKTQILTKDYEIEMIDQLTEFHIETGLYEYARMQTAWEAWQAAKAQAIPEGFVLVPKEPTDAMLFAASGRDIVAEHYGDENIMWPELRETWKAMLEAARGGNE